MSLAWIDNDKGICPAGTLSKEELRKLEQEQREREIARQDVEEALADRNLQP